MEPREVGDGVRHATWVGCEHRAQVRITQRLAERVGAGVADQPRACVSFPVAGSVAVARLDGVTEEDELDRLLDEAATADGPHRIDYRDPIARFWDAAVARLEPWLRDSRLAAFAVRTIMAAGGLGAAGARATLEIMHGWADELRCEPDEVELGIFRASLPPASRWAGI